jgi:hypothetical protein
VQLLAHFYHYRKAAFDRRRRIKITKNERSDKTQEEACCLKKWPAAKPDPPIAGELGFTTGRGGRREVCCFVRQKQMLFSDPTTIRRTIRATAPASLQSPIFWFWHALHFVGSVRSMPLFLFSPITLTHTVPKTAESGESPINVLISAGFLHKRNITEQFHGQLLSIGYEVDRIPSELLRDS